MNKWWLRLSVIGLLSIPMGRITPIMSDLGSTVSAQSIDILPEEYQGYKKILQAYQQLRDNHQEFPDLSLNVAAAKNSALTLVYGLYDIDGNGIEELLISAETDDRQADYAYSILDIYTLKGQQAQSLTPTVEDLGKTQTLAISQEGLIVIQEQQAKDQPVKQLFKITETGDTIEEIEVNKDHQKDPLIPLKDMASWVAFLDGTRDRLPIAQDQSMGPQNTKDYPFAVVSDAIQEGLRFTRKNDQSPQTIEIFPRAQKVLLTLQDGKVKEYVANFQAIPTQTIEVQSNTSANASRSVQVNTQISLGNNKRGKETTLSGESCYLFYNRQGGLSLAIPDRMGNGEKDSSKIYLEYVSQQ